jgi:hypothetical protein
MLPHLLFLAWGRKPADAAAGLLASGFRRELATLTMCNEKCLWPGRIGLVKGPVRPSRRHFPDED